MTSLGKGLAHLGVGPAQVVHVKAFLGPVREHARVRQEIAAFFAGAPVPPIVFVEWVSSLPIEIELVATGPATGSAPEHLQHHRLPGLTPSPRYSHAATVEPGSPLIFTSGLYGQGGPDARREWQEIFAELGATLFAAGGGFRHLVKATYYNADANGQRVLGEIRDVYYDPARPPAASAAVVKGVGLPGKTAMMEVIGVPLRVSR
jgi:enamine deaminase RidA (YjgF/YER057c/UK114 family)